MSPPESLLKPTPDPAESTAARGRRGSLVIVGTGIQWAGQTTLAAQRAIQTAQRVLFAVADAGTAQWLHSLRPDAVSLRYGTREGQRRREVYNTMVEDLLTPLREGLRVCAVFYGHPGVLSLPAHEALRQAHLEGFNARMLPGVSFLDCLFADLGLDPGLEGCLSYEATDFLLRRRPFEVHTPLILSQIALIGNPEVFNPSASQRIRQGLATLSEVLRTRYPASHEVIVYDASPHPLSPPKILRYPLGALANAQVGDLSTLYIPPTTRAPIDEAMRQRLLFKPTPDAAPLFFDPVQSLPR